MSRRKYESTTPKRRVKQVPVHCRMGPVSIQRWQGEENDPYSSLDWSYEKRNRYDYVRFENQSNTFTLVESEESPERLPPSLLEVVDSFMTNIPVDSWKDWTISWHKSTPAIQFSNKRPLLSESLPESNIFLCDTTKNYLNNCSNSQLKSEIVTCLIGQMPDWWEKTFSHYIYTRTLNNPKITAIKDRPGTRTCMVRYEEDGFKTTRTFPFRASEAESHPEIETPADLKGEKTVPIELKFGDYIYEEMREDRVILSTGKIKQDAVEYLAQEYKIRIQVKPQYQVWLTAKLLELFTKDDVGAYVKEFKCSLVYSLIATDDPNRLASIVIYVQPGRICAERVLQRLVYYFEHCEEELGLDITSRYNIRVNPLLYYSCGDGDTKLQFEELGIIDRYFESTTVEPYALFKGQRPLEIF